MSTVATGYVRLNRAFFNESKLKVNKHHLSQVERVSYPTVLKYLGDEDIRNFSGEILFAILVTGMGYTVEELRNIPLHEIFEFVEEDTK